MRDDRRAKKRKARVGIAARPAPRTAGGVVSPAAAVRRRRRALRVNPKYGSTRGRNEEEKPVLE